MVDYTPKLRFREFTDEWQEKKLGELATFFDGKRIPLSQSDRHKRQGRYPYYGASGVIDQIDDYIFDGEYILLGEDGANIIMRNSRLAFLVRGKFWVNNHAHVLRSKNSNYFLAEYLERLKYDDYNTGTAQPKLNAAVCKKIVLIIPSSKEQQKIADFLTAVDEKIWKLEHKKKAFEKYKKGIMQAIFSQKLRFKPDLSSEASVKLGGSNYPDWEEKKLGAIGEIIGGGTPDTNKNEYWNGEIFWLTPTEVKTKHISKSIRTISQKGLKDSSAKLLPKGTVIFTSRATVGDVGITTVELSTNQGFQSIVVDHKNSNEFIYYWILYNKKLFVRKASGSTFLEVSRSEMLKIKGLFPTKEEQERIAELLTSLDKKVDLISKELEQAKLFKKSLLQQMFV